MPATRQPRPDLVHPVIRDALERVVAILEPGDGSIIEAALGNEVVYDEIATMVEAARDLLIGVARDGRRRGPAGGVSACGCERASEPAARAPGAGPEPLRAPS